MRIQATLAAAFFVLICFTPAKAQEIRVQDDPFHPYIIMHTPVQTIGAVPRAYLFTVGVSIDRKTKARSWDVRWGAVYSDKQWHHYYMAAMEGGIELPRIARDANVQSCSGRGSGCHYNEHLIFSLTEAQVRTAAKNGLRLKMFSQSGNSTMASVTADEMANLLNKATTYQK